MNGEKSIQSNHMGQEQWKSESQEIWKVSLGLEKNQTLRGSSNSLIPTKFYGSWLSLENFDTFGED